MAISREETAERGRSRRLEIEARIGTLVGYREWSARWEREFRGRWVELGGYYFPNTRETQRQLDAGAVAMPGGTLVVPRRPSGSVAR